MTKPVNTKKLFLLDAYALIFRAYYAFAKNPRFNSAGLNTSAILGFTNTLEEVLRIEKPSHIAVVFDPPTPNFRKQLYPEYKAHRKETPEEIILSVPYIKSIIEAYNIPVLEVDGFEADDTIGTLAKKAEKEGFDVFMMTPDKDFIQLLSDNIFMYKPKRGGNEVEIFTVESAKEKFGINDPMQFIEILAIWGDTADNIPGIPGIGEKTAIKLISQFGDIEGIYKNINKLKGKQKENVENSRELVKLSKELVTIITDVPIQFEEEKLLLEQPDYIKLGSLFKELEFNALAQRVIPSSKPETQSPNVQGNLFSFPGESVKEIEIVPIKKFNTIHNTSHNYSIIDTKRKRENLIEKLSVLSEFCFDTETTGVDAIEAELVGISFSFKSYEAFYIPIPEDISEVMEIISEFKALFENPDILKIGQNIKYDIMVLRNYGVEVKGKLFDTMIAHYLLAPEERHNMTRLSEIFLDYTPVPIEELIGAKGKNQKSMRDVSIEKIKEYAGEDADVTWRLKKLLENKLKDYDLYKLATEIEFPLIYVLAYMERNGVKIDTEKLHKFAEDLTTQIADIEKEIYKLSGTEFNISSPKQLGEILFDKLKISDNPKQTKTKQYSTAEEELVKLKGSHKIVEEILKYRSLTKLLSTYVSALPKLVNKRTGKIHTSYNQAVTTTGRLSSTNPNLQNIPIRTEEGKKIREAFIPGDDNNVLLAADYSQVELRIMAHLSKDPGMIEAFANNEDIHRATAAKINKIELSEVTPEMRSIAKSANFGIIYGISAHGLSQNLGISRTEAKQIIDGYFESYPKVKEYMDESIKFTRDNSYAQTLLGRKRMLYEINSNQSFEKSNAERNAINAPIQGSAADIIKIAMINCHKRLISENLNSAMILQVHDELVFDVDENELEIVKAIAIEEMENAFKLSVPLLVEVGTGKNWLEAH